MRKRNYYTTPYTSFAQSIRREFAIPVPGVMDLMRDDLELYVGRDGQLRYFAPAVLATAAPVLEKVPVIGKLVDKAKDLLSKVGLGGSDQDRLIKRYYEIKDFLKSRGYDSGGNLDTWLDQFNIRKTDLKNNQKQPYWKAAYERLRQFTITWLNYKNPGLGDVYGQLFPEWKMVNEGQIYSEPIDALKELVKAFPPGTYYGGTPVFQSAQKSPSALMASIANAPATAPPKDPDDGSSDKKAETNQIITYTTVGLAVALFIIAIVVQLKSKSS